MSLFGWLAPVRAAIARAMEGRGGAPVPSELAEAELPESVMRARSMVGAGFYCLGAGGRDPDAPRPFGACAKPKEHTHGKYGKALFCDCSGAVCWFKRIHRKNADGTWNYTDAWEAIAAGRVKSSLGYGVPWHEAQPGDIVVYGAGKAIGHCGIVSEVDDAGPVKVIHCQASRVPAVVETSAALFERHRALILRTTRDQGGGEP